MPTSNGNGNRSAAMAQGLNPYLGDAQILDQVTIKPFDEYGLTGLDYSAGIINEDLIRNLAGRQAMLVWKDMRDNEPVCGSTLFAISMLVRQVEWTVEPFSEDEQDTANAEFVDECMDDMSHSWADFINEALSMLPFGWAWMEIVYKRRSGPNKEASLNSKHTDGKIGWRKIPLRAQETIERWLFDENGGVKAMVQMAPPDYKIRIIPIEKSLLFRASSHKGNPEGRSVFRSAYRPWYFKKRIEEIEGIGIERDLAGLPMAYVDPEILMNSATPDQVNLRTRIEKIVKNIRRDTQEGILWPMVYDTNNNQLYKFELLSTGGTRQFNTTEIIQRYDQRIAMTVLADFILLGHEQVGSYALSDSKTNLFAVALGTWLDGIAEVVNRYAIPRLFDINNMPMDRLPKLKHGDIEVPDMAALGALITALSGAGMQIFPDPKLEDYLRSLLKWPEQTEEDKVNIQNMLQEKQQRAMEAMQQTGGQGGFPAPKAGERRGGPAPEGQPTTNDQGTPVGAGKSPGANA